MHRSEFVETDILQLDALSVANPHLFSIFFLDQTCFHRKLELKNTACITVAFICSYPEMSRQGDTNRSIWILIYTYDKLLSVSIYKFHSKGFGWNIDGVTW